MPYASTDALPVAVKTALTTERLRQAWLKAFNAAFKEYGGDEKRAFATAWATIGEIATKGKDGKWTVKPGKEQPAKKSAGFVADVLGGVLKTLGYGMAGLASPADEPEPDEWDPEPFAPPAPAPGTSGSGTVGKRVPFEIAAEVRKVDDEMHVVWGWASVIEEGGRAVVDKQGDVIGEADLIEAAHGFMRDARLAKAMHEGDGIGEVVESVVFTRDLQKALGIDLGRVGWLIGMHVEEPGAWALFKDGTYTGFSIAGTAIVEEAAYAEAA